MGSPAGSPQSFAIAKSLPSALERSGTAGSGKYGFDTVNEEGDGADSAGELYLAVAPEPAPAPAVAPPPTKPVKRGSWFSRSRAGSFTSRTGTSTGLPDTALPDDPPELTPAEVMQQRAVARRAMLGMGVQGAMKEVQKKAAAPIAAGSIQYRNKPSATGHGPALARPGPWSCGLTAIHM